MAKRVRRTKQFSQNLFLHFRDKLPLQLLFVFGEISLFVWRIQDNHYPSHIFCP